MISEISIPSDRFRYYGFRITNDTMLLPPGVELVIDRFCGYSILLAWNRMNNQVITASKFTTDELPMLFLLCEHWPSMVTHELLMTALHPAPNVPLVSYQIEDARNTNTLDPLIAPLRQQINHYRNRLRDLGLDVREVEENGRCYGYRLIQAQGTPNGGCGSEVMREA